VAADSAVPRKVHERLAQERRLRAVAEWRDIRQQEIALALEVSPVNYNRYETGVTPIPDEVIERAAKYFGVTRAFLRYGEGERTPGAEVPAPRPAISPIVARKKSARGGR
jgi:transcriptional regulator with XRE-family HTH domain